MKSAKGAVTAGLVVILTACSVATTPESTDSLMDIPSQQAIFEASTATTILVTATATRTPQLTDPPTPTEKPTLPTPSPNEWKAGLDFLFDESIQPTGCELPCWMGLVPGSSTKEEVNEVLSEVFGFENPPGFFGYAEEWDSALPVMRSHFYYWTQKPTFSLFGVSAMISEESTSLEALTFSWGSQTINAVNTPANAVRRLGTPSEILISINSTAESHSEGRLKLVIVYQRGLIFHYITHMTMDVTYGADGELQSISAPICFEGSEWTETTEIVLEATVYLTQPIADSKEDLSSLHDYIFYRNFEIQTMKPLAEITEMNMQAITNLIVSGNCIDVAVLN
jgi:hypothetical protein